MSAFVVEPNCIHGDFAFPSRAVFNEYSNVPNAEKPAWVANPANAGRWQRVNAVAVQQAASDDGQGPTRVNAAPLRLWFHDKFSNGVRVDEHIIRDDTAANEYSAATDKAAWREQNPDAWIEGEQPGTKVAVQEPKAQAPSDGLTHQERVKKAAKEYQARGYAVVRLKAEGGEDNTRGKAAFDKGWTKAKPTDPTPEFLPNNGVGIVLGDASGGRVRLDPDWTEANEIVAALFPEPTARFGRASARGNGRLFHCQGMKSKTWKLPSSMAKYPGLPEHGLTVAQVLSTGSQTMAPPSIHPCGEVLEWETTDEPAEISADVLTRRMGLVSALAVIAHCWPAEGHRHEAAPALCRVLLESLSDIADTEQRIKLCERLVLATMRAARDDEADNRVRHVRKTFEKMESGEANTTGLPTLIKLLGLPADVEATLREWLGAMDGRPSVLVNPFDLTGTAARTEAALIQAGVPIYQRGGQLVHIHRLDDDKSEDGVQRRKGTLSIYPVNAARLTLYLDEHVSFSERKIVKGVETTKRIPVPSGLAHNIEALADQWRLPVLAGFIECPTLRPDGTPLQTPGYDVQTGLVYEPGDTKFPPIPENPTKADAEASLTVLTDALDEFPFVTGDDSVPLGTTGIPCASRSAGISNVLTGTVRRTMDRAPAGGVDANSIASGKSALCDVTAIITTGREAPVITLPRDDEEAAKVWLSVLSRGDAIVVIDNVLEGQVVSGAVLSSILTQSTFKGRVLGGNTMLEVPTNVLVLVNGNNLVFGADMASRAINSRLNAGLEHPDRRRFKRDLTAWAKAHRGELVAAALTILRAYIVAGRPKPEGFEPSRFPQWDDLARGALIWLGQPDPQLTRVDIDAADPARADLASLIDALAKCFAGKWFTSKQIVERINGSDPKDEDGRNLRAAISGMTKDGGLGQRTITALLRAHGDKIVGGRRLRRSADTHGVVQSRIEAVKDPEQGRML